MVQSNTENKKTVLVVPTSSMGVVDIVPNLMAHPVDLQKAEMHRRLLRNFSKLTSEEYNKLGPNILVNSPLPHGYKRSFSPALDYSSYRPDLGEIIKVKKSDFDNLANSLNQMIYNSRYDDISRYIDDVYNVTEIADQEHIDESVNNSEEKSDQKSEDLVGYIHSSEFGILLALMFFGLSVISFFAGGSLVNPVISLVVIISGVTFYMMGRVRPRKI